jgi:3-hydroxyisobutyrate dehydrogenase-like beta-hydroxyacid dehydrogenase
MNVGVIGLGTMGGRMVGALLDAGHEVIVHDVSTAAVERTVAVGAKPASSAVEVGAAAQVVLLSLPLPEDVVAVVGGEEEGLLSRPADGLVVVDMSTVDPGTTQQLASRAAAVGVGYLDAPVLGRPDACGKWTLPIGGDSTIMERARPALEPLASTITHVGESGAGNAIKLINNLMFGAINAITVEAFAIAALVGVSPRQFYNTVVDSGAATVSNLFRQLGPKILEEDFSPTFTVDLLQKDNRLAIAMVEDRQASVILGSAVTALNGLAQASGYGSEDTSAAIKVYEKVLGVKVSDYEQE